MTIHSKHQHPLTDGRPETLGGLPVRTDVRAGLNWDDLGAQAMALWQQLTDAVPNAAGRTGGPASPSA